MNGSVFIFSFFIRLLVVNMKALDLGKLILYLTALLNLFIVSRSFLAESWASLMYIIMAYQNRDSLAYFSFLQTINFLFLL